MIVSINVIIITTYTHSVRRPLTNLVHIEHKDLLRFLVGIDRQVFPVHCYTLLPLHMGCLLSKDRRDSQLCLKIRIKQ